MKNCCEYDCPHENRQPVTNAALQTEAPDFAARSGFETIPGFHSVNDFL
jgi:hypothetical protein